MKPLALRLCTREDQTQEWWIKVMLRFAGEIPHSLYRLYGPYSRADAEAMAEELRPGKHPDAVVVEHRPQALDTYPAMV
jgi:hypothetical protein